LRFFADHRLPFPRRLWAPSPNGRLHWGPLSLSRLLAILHNPTYTGAYVYGRRRSTPVVVAGQVVRTRTLQRPQAQWMVVIQDAHPAYLSWED
jgi:Recombinase